MMHGLVVVWLIGCGTPPEVSSVDPAEGLAGAPLKVLGSDFPEGAALWMVKGDEAVQVADAQVRGPVLIEGTVPAGLSAGVWTVEVRIGDRAVSLSDAFTVAAQEAEVPCGGQFKANTQLSLARGLVVVDRFYTDERRETLRIPIPEIEQVEYELIALEGEAAEAEAGAAEGPRLCSVIYMKKKDGRRVVFDDDTRLNLEPRAYKLGNVMKKKTVTTRKDVQEDPRPVEEN